MDFWLPFIKSVCYPMRGFEIPENKIHNQSQEYNLLGANLDL